MAPPNECPTMVTWVVEYLDIADLTADKTDAAALRCESTKNSDEQALFESYFA